MATDAEIRAKGIKFLPLQKYLQNPYEFPVEETAPASEGIVNTNAFTGGGNDNFNPAGNNFQNNTNVLGLRTPGSDFASSGSYVTNRTNSGSMLPGAEEEENFLQKILRTGGRGIAAMIPGAGMLTSVADKFDRYDDLNPLDQEFIQSQMSGYEQNIHGTQNLPQQDRYGYNKRSALGNYSELIDKRVKVAEDFYADKGYYRPIDEYYMDKAKDKNTIQSQMDMNDIVRNRAISNKLRSGDPKNNPSSKDYQPVGPNSPPTPSNNDNGNQNQGGGGASDISDRDRGGYATDDTASFFARGGRAGYFFGGRARLQGGGGAGMGAPEKAAERARKGYGTTPDTGSKSGTNDYSTTTQDRNHDIAMRDYQNPVPKESILNKTMNLGSELSYLNNLKNLNVLGIVGNIGVNKFRNYIKNKNLTEEDKLSYNTNNLPTNNYFADLNATQIKQLEGPQKMGKEYGNFSDQEILDNITPFGDEETAPATLKDVQTFYGSNGGLASIL